MKTVKGAMTPNIVTIPSYALIDAAIERMLSENISALPVVDEEERLVGIISEFDLLQLYGKSVEDYRPYEPCEKYMTRRVKTIGQDASLNVAARIFQAASLRRLLVVDGDRLVGVLSRRDILRSIRIQREAMALT